MTELRIIDISESPARLRVSLERLVVETSDKQATIPLPEIACLVVSNPQTSYSHAALAGLAKNNAALVVCDEKHLPCAMLLPLAGHHLQSERFAAQAAAPLPLKKQAWKQIVIAKVKAQARLLEELHGNDRGLAALASRVKSGDSTHIEAQASRRYWPALFQDQDFKRDRNRKDQNQHLNYGYAVLRAVIARAVCGAGLHPSLGIHHHNRYDTFCLADDLMEPFRPIVDRAVVKWTKDHDPKQPLDREAKNALLSALLGKFELQGEKRNLFDIASKTASSLAQVFEGKRSKLVIPEV